MKKTLYWFICCVSINCLCNSVSQRNPFSFLTPDDKEVLAHGKIHDKDIECIVRQGKASNAIVSWLERKSPST